MNKAMIGQKLSLSSGLVSVDAEGCIEIENKAEIAALQDSCGFKPVFTRKSLEEKPAVTEPKVAPVLAPKEPEVLSTSKVSAQPQQHKKGK